MSLNLTLFAILFSFLIIIFIIRLIAKEKVNIKYAIIWILMFALIIVFTLIPGFLLLLTKVLGFQTASNMILYKIVAVLVIINISNTVINSEQDRKLRLLIQELSILKRGKKDE